MQSIRFSIEQSQNAIDLGQIKQKAFKTVKHFIDDIKWFQHNCRTINAKDNINKLAKELTGCVKEHIEMIRACSECFENSHKYGKKSVTLICSQPHLLLWAKVTGYGYWPAKLMTTNADAKTVHVRFFGDCTKSVLPACNCLLYSKDRPGNKNSHKNSYPKAVEVSFDLNIYR